MEEQDLTFGSIFVVKFVEYFNSTVEKYKSIAEPGSSSQHSNPIASVTGSLAGGVFGAFLGFVGPGPSSSSSSAFNYAHNRFQHKEKAKAILKIISKLYYQKEQLNEILVDAAVELFRIFFQQFLRIAAQFQWGTENSLERSFEKLAHDATCRCMNFLQDFNTKIFNNDIVVKAVIRGDSKKSTVSKLSWTAFGSKGHYLEDLKWNTNHMFKGTPIYLVNNANAKSLEDGLYEKSKNPEKYQKFGFRLVAQWELKDYDDFIKNSGYVKKSNAIHFNQLECSANLLNHLKEKVMKILREANWEISLIKFDSELKKQMKLCENIKSQTERITTDLAMFKTTAELVKENDEQSSSSSNPYGNPHLVFGLIPSVINFSGRNKERNFLKETYNSKTVHGSLLSGLSGIGKTQLARKFVEELIMEYPNLHIAWLTGESPETLRKSLEKFCHHHHIQINVGSVGDQHQEQDISQLMEHIKIKFSSTAGDFKLLFVLDNVDEAYEEFKLFMEKVLLFHCDKFVIVTSILRELLPSTLKFTEIKGLEPEEGVELFKKSLDFNCNDDQDSAIKLLCEKLDNFPLALQQAVAYIKVQRQTSLRSGAYSIDDYRKELEKNEITGLNIELELSQYSNSTVNAWDYTINKVSEHPDLIPIRLLEIMALLSPDEISMELLHKTYNQIHYEHECEMEEIKKGAERLLKYNLISSYNCVLSILRLVQLSVRLKMKNKMWSGNENYFDGLLSQFWKTFNEDEFEKDEMLHILSFWAHTTPNKELVIKFSSTPEKISDALYYRGMINEGYEFSKFNSVLLERLLRRNHLDSLKMKLCTVQFLAGKSKYEEALKDITALYDKLKSILGEDHPLALETSRWISVILRRMGREEESMERDRANLQAHMNKYGMKHQKTIAVQNNLATSSVFYDEIPIFGTYYEPSAKPRFGLVERPMATSSTSTDQLIDVGLANLMEVLEWRKDTLGEQHYDTLSTKQNIAEFYYKRGDFAKAKTELSELMVSRGYSLGITHPDTLETQFWLAKTIYEMGDGEQTALVMMKKVLASQKFVLGQDHLSTQITQSFIDFMEEESKRKTQVSSVDAELRSNVSISPYTSCSPF